MASPSISIAIGVKDNATDVFRKVNTGLEQIGRQAARTGTYMGRFGDVTGLNRVASGVGEVQRRIGMATATLGRFAPALAGLASAATIGGIGDLIQKFTVFGSALGLSAQRAGFTATQLHGLQGAARIAGSSADALTSGVTTLQDHLSNAARGQDPEFVGLMGSLGIAFTDAAGHARQAADVMPELANAISHARGPTEAAIIATRGFGAAGESLLPFFLRGAAGMAEYNAQAARHGLFNERGVAAANAMRTAQTNLAQAFEGLGYSVSERVSPPLGHMLTTLSEWVDANREPITGFFERVAKGIESWVASGGLDRMIQRFERLYNSMVLVVNFADRIGRAARGNLDNPNAPAWQHLSPYDPNDHRTPWERAMPRWLGGRDAPGSALPTPPRPLSTSQLGPVLNLIGRAEGTDAGRGYNETLGYGRFTGGPVDLTHMTLDQVDALQNRMLTNPWNAAHSSAAGRYQFTQTTLRDMRERYGLQGSAMFDEAMQDRLAAMRIAMEPGGLTGTGLSHIWASLPNPATGTSYYGQRTGASVTEVDQAIAASRVTPAQRFGFPMHDDPNTWPTAPAAAPVPSTSIGTPGAAGPNGQATVRLTFDNPPPGLRTSTITKGELRVETQTLGATP